MIEILDISYEKDFQGDIAITSQMIIVYNLWVIYVCEFIYIHLYIFRLYLYVFNVYTHIKAKIFIYRKF